MNSWARLLFLEVKGTSEGRGGQFISLPPHLLPGYLDKTFPMDADLRFRRSVEGGQVKGIQLEKPQSRLCLFLSPSWFFFGTNKTNFIHRL